MITQLAEDNTRLIDLQTFTQLMSQQKPFMLDPLTHTQLAWIGLEGNVRHPLIVDAAPVHMTNITPGSTDRIATHRTTSLAQCP